MIDWHVVLSNSVLWWLSNIYRQMLSGDTRICYVELYVDSVPIIWLSLCWVVRYRRRRRWPFGRLSWRDETGLVGVISIIWHWPFTQFNHSNPHWNLYSLMDLLFTDRKLTDCFPCRVDASPLSPNPIDKLSCLHWSICCSRNIHLVLDWTS
jgi:hypothetical protein